MTIHWADDAIVLAFNSALWAAMWRYRVKVLQFPPQREAMDVPRETLEPQLPQMSNSDRETRLAMHAAIAREGFAPGPTRLVNKDLHTPEIPKLASEYAVSGTPRHVPWHIRRKQKEAEARTKRKHLESFTEFT